MSPLLCGSIGLVRGWTRLYTLRMQPPDRDRRRAEIESDLWEFHEDARRRGASPESIAMHMLARLVLGIPHDLVWRVEYEGDANMARRRSTWMTLAAVGAAAGIAALWAFLAATSIGALPPLPDSAHVERVYLRRMPPPPPPPPPLPDVVTRQQRYPLEAPPPPR